MNIHCTKKLMAKLPFEESPAVEYLSEPAQRLFNWHANLITIQRKQCVILVNDATRYAVFLPSMTKPELKHIEQHFHDVFVNSLIKAGLEFPLIEVAAKHLHEARFKYDTVCSRSVQGTMRLMTEDLDWSLYHNSQHIDDIALYSTSAWLSDRPCNVKGVKDCIWPVKAMTELLLSLQQI
ncbi:DUF6933 domain-containing protein [Alteromonas oceani]|uniref:DUF6933 domain-containing protein n=1 Tax=Alteromonas oceani TaxID=2071609 RepID=A0ABV7JY66_9ALTE